MILLQKEMSACISDDIKPIGCTFNLASSSVFKNFGFVLCYGLVELKLEVVHLLLNIYYISLQMFEHKTTDMRLA